MDEEAASTSLKDLTYFWELLLLVYCFLELARACRSTIYNWVETIVISSYITNIILEGTRNIAKTVYFVHCINSICSCMVGLIKMWVEIYDES